MPLREEVGGEAAFAGQLIDIRLGSDIANDMVVTLIFESDPDDMVIDRRAGTGSATRTAPRRRGRTVHGEDRCGPLEGSWMGAGGPWHAFAADADDRCDERPTRRRRPDAEAGGEPAAPVRPDIHDACPSEGDEAGRAPGEPGSLGQHAVARQPGAGRELQHRLRFRGYRRPDDQPPREGEREDRGDD